MSRRLAQFLIHGLLSLFAAAALHAQTIRWNPPSGALAVGQTTELQLVFEDCAPDQAIPVPKIDGLVLQEVGRASNTSIINFTRTDSVIVNFAVNLTKKQRVTIPPFAVNTNKGRLTTPAATFEADAATVGNTGVALETAANSRLVATPATVWAGEVFTLNYTLDAAHSYSPDFGRGQFDWNPEPLLAEDWSRPEPLNFRAGAEARDGLAYRTRAIARTPGATRLNAVHQLLNLGVGVVGFGFFQQRQYQQFSLTSTAPLLEVKPLPPAPVGFTGAVGSLKLNSKVIPATAAVGEPITWTLELTGTANWPDVAGLPARDVSKNFQVVSPQPKRTPVEGKLFEATLTEDIVLVPTKPGAYTLGPLTFSYFDPQLGRYQTITTPATTVTVTPEVGRVIPNAPSSTQSADESKIQNQKSKILPAAAPAALPRDPLPGRELAPLPLAPRTIILLVTVPFVLPIILWLWLALRRARATDPLRPRREAHARLEKLLADLRAGSPASPQRLLHWQHDTSILLQIATAAPTSTSPEIENPKSKIQNLPKLWSESDRALYGENSPLPADWPARAQAALAAAAVPNFSPLRLFLARNLFPFFALALLLAVSAPHASAQSATQNPKPETQNSGSTDGAAAYRRGDFLAAEKSWRAALAAAPTDSIARHNLSLSLAQQDRWDEAAAHAAAAFVQSPSSEPIRAQFALAAEKSGHIPAPLAAFLTPGPLETLARLASPACWQSALCAAAALLALSLSLLLWIAYRRAALASSPSPLAWLGGVLLALSLGLALTSILGWHLYGESADTRAVIVWRAGLLRSIPTEADTAQKTTPLTAGTLALADKTFLGWQHLTFEAGQAGWVRQDELVPLWK